MQSHMCGECHRVEAKDFWKAVVQVRQKVCVKQRPVCKMCLPQVTTSSKQKVLSIYRAWGMGGEAYCYCHQQKYFCLNIAAGVLMSVPRG